jgi:hypothetical protein
LNNQTLVDLKEMGFKDNEINEALREIELEESQAKLKESFNRTSYASNYDPRSSSPSSSIISKPDENLIKWQLELNEILERAEHVLRGDKLKFIGGNTIWQSPERENEQILNDYGIQEVMRVLSMYVNRNTILSNYSLEEIHLKIYDFGKELSDLFFMKYEAFGWKNNLEKRKNYPMLMREMIDIVHSSYNRALGGKERDTLHEARQITQSEQLSPSGVNVNVSQPRQERSLLNPMRFFGGRYK